MTQTDQLTTPFTMFRVQVAAITALGANFRRITFRGDDLQFCAENGYDQRIKLIFPLPGVGLEHLPTGADWYQQWRRLPAEHRNPIRTYTIRATRPEQGEIDVDIALHGRIGVASAWACDAAPGDELVILGPNARHDGVHGGIDFLPPAGTDRYLLAGDETALPAIAAILERLPADAQGIAVLEVGDHTDAAALGACPLGVEIRLAGRSGASHGSHLLPVVADAAAVLLDGWRGDAPTEVEDVDVDNGLLWEVPTDDHGGPARAATPLYSWLAGEAAVIKSLRRHLVTECGIDRKSVAFMGYWRLGRAEDNG